MFANIIQEKRIIEQSLFFYYWIHHQRRFLSNSIKFDPVSWLIITKIQTQFRLDAFLQSYSLLRYSDLNQLDLIDLFSGKYQQILQSKTKRPVDIFPLMSLTREEAIERTREVFPFYFSRDSYSLALTKVIPIWVKSALEKQHSVTHVFRYLRASFLILNNNSLDLASKLLGHSSIEATNSYIPHNLTAEIKKFIDRS